MRRYLRHLVFATTAFLIVAQGTASAHAHADEAESHACEVCFAAAEPGPAATAPTGAAAPVGQAGATTPHQAAPVRIAPAPYSARAPPIAKSPTTKFL